MPDLHQDWAHPGHISTGLTSATTATGLTGLTPRHIYTENWAHPGHICTGTP